MADSVNIDSASSLAGSVAYSRSATRAAQSALEGLGTARADESREFKLGPLRVRVESSPAPAESPAHRHIADAARRMADQVRSFNFQENLDVEDALAALRDVSQPDFFAASAASAVREGSQAAHAGAAAALEGMAAAAPSRTAASGVRAYGSVEQRTRRHIPNMVNARV